MLTVFARKMATVVSEGMAEKVKPMKIPMIDIGANLLDPMFRGVYREKQRHESDFDLVLERAYDVGVEKIIITAGSKEEASKCIELCQTDPERLFTTVGVHPTRCNEFNTATGGGNEYLAELVSICQSGKIAGNVVAVGEFGLDYDRTQFCPMDVQKKCFDMQFALAEETGLPLFLHNRASSSDLIQILQKNRHAWEKAGGVVHSFDGTMAEMKTFVDMGLHIGINGCSLRTEDSLNVVKEIPIDRLLVETDAPWCGIKNTHPGKKFVKTVWQEKKEKKFAMGSCVKNRCEPCHLIQVVEVLAHLRAEDDVMEFGTKLRDNTEKLFFSNK